MLVGPVEINADACVRSVCRRRQHPAEQAMGSEHMPRRRGLLRPACRAPQMCAASMDTACLETSRPHTLTGRWGRSTCLWDKRSEAGWVVGAYDLGWVHVIWLAWQQQLRESTRTQQAGEASVSSPPHRLYARDATASSASSSCAAQAAGPASRRHSPAADGTPPPPTLIIGLGGDWREWPKGERRWRRRRRRVAGGELAA